MDYTVCYDCANYLINDEGERPEGLGATMSWQFAPAWDMETGDGIEEFGTSDCDLCNTSLVGLRYPFIL